MNRRLALLGLVTTAAFAFAGAAIAQTFPSKPLNMVIPTAPGGTGDIIGRLVREKMEQNLGQTIIANNKPGANGTIGTAAVAKSPPDGYTFFVASSATSGAASLYNNLTYDTIKDLAPIASIAVTPYFLFASTSLPANNIQELIALAKAKPGSIAYASTGPGAFTHLAAELFAYKTGTKLLHVPYNGTGQGLIDVATGQVQIMFTGLPAAMPFVQAGKLKILGAATLERSSLKPDVPTISEQGVPGFEAASWFGLIAPGGTPEDRLERIAAAVKVAVDDPNVQKHLTDLGAVPFFQGPKAFRTFFDKDVAASAEIVKISGATAN